MTKELGQLAERMLPEEGGPGGGRGAALEQPAAPLQQRLQESWQGRVPPPPPPPPHLHHEVLVAIPLMPPRAVWKSPAFKPFLSPSACMSSRTISSIAHECGWRQSTATKALS